MPNPVGPLTRHYLKRCGYKDSQIDSWSDETRMLHDIGLFGDNVLDEFERMRTEFGVDFTAFDFTQYFPSELSHDAFLLTLLGRTTVGCRIMAKYSAITLGMIEVVLSEKKWGIH